MRIGLRDGSGQATVELVALVPVLLVVAAVAWQLVVVGWAVWSAESRARSAARAVALGASPGLGARVAADGAVVVSVPVRTVVGGGVLLRVRARASFERQR